MKRLLVTVGTDHHRFDRLVQWADLYALNHPDIDVLVQYGSAQPPKHARGSQLLDHAQLQYEIGHADAVICHGGPATITEVRRAGLVPVCVPRDPGRSEHVDGHQQRFVERLAVAGILVRVRETAQLEAAVAEAFTRHPVRLSLSQASSAQLPEGVQRVGALIDNLLSSRTQTGRRPTGSATHPAVKGSDSRVTVLFIGGQGRSGSTLLERAISQFPGATSVGEVVHLWRRGLRGNETCGCGKAFHACPFWTAVGDEAFGGWANLDPEESVELRYAVDRTRYVPLMLRPGLSPRYARRRAEYLTRLASLYRAMAKVSGGTVLVDSSKHPSYALLLAAIPEIDLRLLHVVRDSPAVAFAWSRTVERPEANGIPMPTYGPTKAAVMWDVQNTIMQTMGRRLPYLRIRYEDFVTSPKDTLLEVMRFAGESDDADQLQFLDGDTLHLQASHTVAGNPMRFITGDLTIRRDERWQTDMTAGNRKVVELLTVPFRRKYGYGGNHR